MLTDKDPRSPLMRAIACALPENYYAQEVLTAALWQTWGGGEEGRTRFERIHRAVGVRGRHLALPMTAYPELGSFAKANDAWIRIAAELGTSALEGALRGAELTPADVDHLFFTTVTGIAAPSIDARLINRLAMRSDIKRTPIFGLGCVGGAAGVARAADYLLAFPDQVAVLLSIELCSLTLQFGDRSIANTIATGLFGDGAAAVVLCGGARETNGVLPRIIASRSVFFPNTEDLMGWEVVETGFQVVLAAGVPDLIRETLRTSVDAFLTQHNLSRSKITHWIAHTGGPKVLEAIEAALELPRCALGLSWQSLAKVGNLSSASVLFVAAEMLESKVAHPGEYGVLLAMGPGFCGELVLLRW